MFFLSEPNDQRTLWRELPISMPKPSRFDGFSDLDFLLAVSIWVFLWWVVMLVVSDGGEGGMVEGQGSRRTRGAGLVLR